MSSVPPAKTPRSSVLRSSVLRSSVLRSSVLRRALGLCAALWLVACLPLIYLVRERAEHADKEWWQEQSEAADEWAFGNLEAWQEHLEEWLEEKEDVEEDPWLDEADEEEGWQREEPEEEDPGEGDLGQARAPEDEEDPDNIEEDLALAVTAEMLARWVREEAWPGDPREEYDHAGCWWLSNPGQELQLGNLKPLSDHRPRPFHRFEPGEHEDHVMPGSSVMLPISARPSTDAGRQWLGAPAGEPVVGEWICIGRQWTLGDGTDVFLGLAVPGDAETAGRSIWWWAYMWLILSLAWAVFIAFRMARPVTTFITDLRRVRDHVERGEPAARLRRRRLSSDLDEAVDEINQILDRLDHSVSSLSQVTDNIAHDLRTPLTRLHGQLDLLRRSESAAPQMLEAVQEEAEQLLSTFNALLRIAQVESGSRRKGFRVFDLSTVVQDVGELYGPAMSEGGLAFSCRSTAQQVWVHGDPDLWMQALSNLLDNAMKYTPAPGQVELALRPGQPVQIRLKDSGSGIPEHELEKVFQRFYRLADHRKQRGSGLGLSLVKAICQLHGAKIQLRNHAGLWVLIQIPAAETANPRDSETS